MAIHVHKYLLLGQKRYEQNAHITFTNEITLCPIITNRQLYSLIF